MQIGGLEQWLSSGPTLPDAVIVAVDVDQLAPITTHLLDYGIRKVLLEKPGGLNNEEINTLRYLRETVIVRTIYW